MGGNHADQLVVFEDGKTAVRPAKRRNAPDIPRVFRDRVFGVQPEIDGIERHHHLPWLVAQVDERDGALRAERLFDVAHEDVRVAHAMHDIRLRRGGVLV